MSIMFFTDSDNESYDSSEEEEEQEGVLSGRRIVELGFLATKLDEGCSKCSSELKLSSCIGEIRYGLGKKLLFFMKYCVLEIFVFYFIFYRGDN